MRWGGGGFGWGFRGKGVVDEGYRMRGWRMGFNWVGVQDERVWRMGLIGLGVQDERVGGWVDLIGGYKTKGWKRETEV